MNAIRMLRDASIRRKLDLTVLLTLVLALTIVCGGILAYDRASFKALTTGNLETLAEVTGANCKAPLEFFDAETAANILASLQAEPDVIMAVLYDAQGATFASYVREGTANRDLPPAPGQEMSVITGTHVLVARNVLAEGAPVGRILLKSSIEKMRERAIKFLGIAVAAFAVAMIVAMMISTAVIGGIVGPINRANTVAKQVATGDLTASVEVPSQDEVGQLMAAIKTMTESLCSLIDKVKHTCILINSSTTSIAASSKGLEATATEQAASTNQVVSTAREISSTSQELVNTMNEVAVMSDETAVAAGSGQLGLIHMETVMKQLEEATESISSKLSAIDHKAAEITTVVTTITKVADQTNLLSLNAAIEADKAGEYGLGFGVVAREIRRLADQTAVATLDIEKVIGEMKGAVADGVLAMTKFSDEVDNGVDEIRNVATQLAQIIEKIQVLTPRFESVKEAMVAQSFGAQQISDAMFQLGQAATHTADSVRGTNLAVDELKSSARVLQDEISMFKTPKAEA